MSDYISRQDAVEVVEFGITIAKAINKATGESIDLFESENEELREAIKRIHDLPSADVVQVVRCKNCVYCDKATYDCHNDRWGNGHAYYPPPVVREDGFCMDGKRKE